MESEEIGVYIKAGSIIARKYTRRMSALQTLNDNYMLDIYPTLEGVRTAKGMLYMDDGETFDDRHTIIHFTYEDGRFKITNSHNTYTQGQSFIIDEVNIFGVPLPPKKVLVANGYIADECLEIQYKYNPQEEHVEVGCLKIHMINSSSESEPLIELVFHEARENEPRTEQKYDL
jgi:hypothetical protein